MPASNNLFSTSITLTNVAIGPTRNQFIGREVYSVLDSTVKTGTIFSIDTQEEARRISDTTRAPGSEAKTKDIQVARPVTFNCTDHALADFVPDEHRAIQNPAIQASVDATQDLMDAVNLEMEVDIKADLDANVTATAVASAWATAATGTPIADIRVAQGQVELAAGVSPNRLALDVSVMRAIADTAEFLDHAKHTTLPTMSANAELLRNILGLEMVIVANLDLQNTAAKGATASLARIWADDAYLYFWEAPRIRTRNTGAITTWTSGDTAGGGTGGIRDGVRVSTWREDKRRSDGIMVGRYYDLNGLNYGACRRLQDTL